MRVLPLPEAKSPLAPSRITVLPRVVNVGAVAFWALSAEILVPPVAAVTVTAACVTLAVHTASPDMTKSIASLFFINFN